MKHWILLLKEQHPVSASNSFSEVKAASVSITTEMRIIRKLLPSYRFHATNSLPGQAYHNFSFRLENLGEAHWSARFVKLMRLSIKYFNEDLITSPKIQQNFSWIKQPAVH